jgi:multiple sugar transport system permease protein
MTPTPSPLQASLFRRRLKWKQTAGLLFAMPGVIYFLAFFIYPFVSNLWYSVHQWDLISPMTFTGLSNYQRMLTDTTLLVSIGKTLYYVVGASIPIWIFSLLYALWFNNHFRGRQFYLVIFLMACLMGLVPSLMAWKILLHQDYGLFNKLFVYSWGVFDKVNWLSDPHLAMPGIIITSLSTGIPFYSIYLIGAVASVPEEYLEVAKLEGANFLQRLWYVILPTIRPVYLFVIIVSLITGFQYLGPFFILTRGGPVDATRVVSLHIWLSAFEFNKFGYASAMTVVLLLVLIPITYLSLRLGGER